MRPRTQGAEGLAEVLPHHRLVGRACARSGARIEKGACYAPAGALPYQYAICSYGHGLVGYVIAAIAYRFSRESAKHPTREALPFAEEVRRE